MAKQSKSAEPPSAPVNPYRPVDPYRELLLQILELCAGHDPYHRVPSTEMQAIPLRLIL